MGDIESGRGTFWRSWTKISHVFPAVGDHITRVTLEVMGATELAPRERGRSISGPLPEA